MHDSHCLPLKLRALPSISLPKGSKSFVRAKSTQVQSSSLPLSFQFRTKYFIPEDFAISRLNDEFATVHFPSAVALSDSDRQGQSSLKHLQEVVATETRNWSRGQAVLPTEWWRGKLLGYAWPSLMLMEEM